MPVGAAGWAILAGIIGLAGGFAATRTSIRMAKGFSVLDLPGSIKLHSTPTPRLGGLGIVTGTLLGSVSAQLLCARAIPVHHAVPVFLGAFLLVCTGVVDDLRGLGPVTKLVGQVGGAAVFLALSGRSLVDQATPFRFLCYLGVVVFLCFMSNSLNLLDGMDGLAGGTAAIMAATLTFVAFVKRIPGVALETAALVGSCVGFLSFNLPPPRTFMGDGGSLFLGYMIGVAALQLVAASRASLSEVLGLGLIVAVPLVDTGLAIVRRLLGRQSILLGDRNHLYDGLYRLLRGNTWHTLLIMWGITALCGAVGVLVYRSAVGSSLITTSAVLFGLLTLAVSTGALARVPAN